MTAPQVPDHPAAPLVAFGEKLGLPAETWGDRESATEITLMDVTVPSAKATALELADFTAVTGAFGPALRGRFVLGELPVLTLGPGLSQAAVDDFRQKAGRVASVQLTLAVDKSALVAGWLGPTPACQVRLYLFPAALENLLSGGLGDLERAWWTGAPGERVLVLVPERELRLFGPYLAVLGGSHCGEAAALAAESGPGAERARAMYGLCRETLRWDEPWVERLTPLHLAAAGQTPDGDGIAGALRTHLANACLLYLADRTERLPAAVGATASTAPGATAPTAPAERLLSTFSGVRNRVPVVAGDPVTAQLPATAAEGLASLVRLVEWAYDATWAGDRLPMAQLAFTEALLPVAPEARFAHFVAAAPAVLDGLRWHWKAFIDGRIDGYEAKVRALEDDVAGVVKAFGDQTAEMIKGLSDTMLATIAVVLGAFVAALLSEKFNAQVFVIACSLYLAYVLLFPLLFNMVHQRTRFLDAGRAFAERLQRYGQQLPPERIADIATGQVEASKGRFRTWFMVTVVAYLALSVLLLMGILNTPRLAATLGAAAVPSATAATASETVATAPASTATGAVRATATAAAAPSGATAAAIPAPTASATASGP